MFIAMYILAALAVALHIAIAVVLVRKYIRTRDAGFIWLGIAVVIWPVLSRLLDGGERVFIDRVIQHQPVGLYPFSLVERGDMTMGQLVLAFSVGEQLIGIVLLLVAVLYLYRTNARPVSS
jgi:hypothetical protein